MTPFSELISSMSGDADRFQLSIPADWMQGRTTYGGLSAAICLAAVERSFPDLPPPRSAMVSFIGPAGGPVTTRVDLLRQGKSVTFIEATLEGEKGIATKVIFAFGAERPSRFDEAFSPMPELPHPDDCEAFIPEGLGPSFASHFDTKLAKGARPFTGSDCTNHFIWVRHKEDVSDHVSLLALADMPPPAVVSRLDVIAPMSSMTWLVNFLADPPVSPDGWWLLQTRAEHAAAGYSSQDMLIWTSDGALAVTGRQSVAVFA